MLRSSVLAELLVLIIIVTYAYVIPSSILSFAQNSGDISDNNSLRGSLLMVQEGVAYSSTPEEAHSMKLEIMTEYFLDSDNDEILVDNGLTLGHLSLDEIEGAYFLKFSMLKILKISKDFTTIVFHGSAWQNSDNAKRISSTDAWVTVSGRSPIMNQSISEISQLQL